MKQMVARSKRPWLLLTSIMAVISLFGVLIKNSTASAQLPPEPFWEVRRIATRGLGIPYPTGLAYSPTNNAFIVLGARQTRTGMGAASDTTWISMNEELLGPLQLTATIADPSNVAYDARTNRLLSLDKAAGVLRAIALNTSQRSTARDVRACGCSSHAG